MLVVDDDECIRLLLAEILTTAGCEVASAEDGAEAIDSLRGSPPDLMLLDLMMPGTSGWDVLAFLDDSPTLNTVPVVILTACGLSVPTPAGRPVIHKPVDGDLLRSLVHELLAQRSTVFDSAEAPSDLLPRPRRWSTPPPGLE